MIKKGGFGKLTVRDVPLRGKTVLVRADYNVPLDKDGGIADDYRLVSSLPTLQYLIAEECKIIICAHLGRPDGKVDAAYSLELVADRLAKLLKQPVLFSPDCIGDGVRQRAKRLQSGQLMLLENLRYHPEEEANDEQFAHSLASDSLAEYFVQDGFGVVHRAHASTDAVTKFLPSVAGLLVEREYIAIRSAIDDPARPLVAVLGGAKISDKIAVIEKFVSIADKIIIGGEIANTFLKERGFKIGRSAYEDGLKGVVTNIYTAAENKAGSHEVDNFLVLPTDVAVASSIEKDSRRVVVGVEQVTEDEMILDIGTDSINRAATIVGEAKTVVWSGTLGYAELPQFSYGSARVALAMASHPEITSIVGGGDTADFILDWDGGHGSSFTHVSTGGSASLDLMADAPMPGIDALLDASGDYRVH